MLSVVGEEFIAYSESVKGQYAPLVAIQKYDGTIMFREVIKEDLLRISDELVVPGGWVFRKSQSTSSSWVKRFALIRGGFLFFFHSPQNEKPIAVVPLEDCVVNAPEGHHKTFDEMRTYKANEGFEFELRHQSRPTVRLYTTSELERTEWMTSLQEHVNAAQVRRQLLGGSTSTGAGVGGAGGDGSSTHASSGGTPVDNENGRSGPIVTDVKLTGLSLQPTSAGSIAGVAGVGGVAAGVGAAIPGRGGGSSVAPSTIASTTMGNGTGLISAQQMQQQQQQRVNSVTSLPPPPFALAAAGGRGSVGGGASYVPQQQPFQQSSPQGAVGGSSSSVAGGAYQNRNPFANPSTASVAGAGGGARSQGGRSSSSATIGAASHSSSSSKPAIYSQQSVPGGGGGGGGIGAGSSGKSPSKRKFNTSRLSKELGFEVLLLEENLKKKLSDQLEARSREDKARDMFFSKENILQAQEKESEDPLTLAKLFRQMLCFIDEEVAEDPQEGTPNQMPHLKGQAVEIMMNTVYRRYCGPSGFMSLEEFIEFFEDSAVLHTHAPHNDNDEPVEEYVTLLDPVRLLTLVPRNIGFSVAEAYDVVNEELMAATKNDKFIINFSQFYMMLLRITQIVYSDLFETDATLAFNKVLQEVICPLFVWCKGHHKRGSKDVLVLEERILLLMTTYAPNLFRVFLTYAHDAVGKVPEITRTFPEAAQSNERGMFRLPAACPAFQIDHQPATDSIFITENGALRFARDYGLIPYVMSVRQIKDAYRKLNRPKVIVSSRLPTRDMLNLQKPHSVAQFDKAARGQGNLQAPMKFASKAQTKSKSGFGTSSTRLASKPMQQTRGGGKSTSTATGNNSPVRAAAAAKEANDDDEDELGSPLPPPPTSGPSPTGTAIGGLSFSEFVEFIALVAVEGMQQENYDAVFPTPFSKVLAMLTVWGVADLKKLEEVRIIHTEDVYQ